MNAPIEAVATDLSVKFITGKDVLRVWHLVAEHVERACDATLTPDDVFEYVYSGQAVLWVVCELDDTIRATLAVRVIGESSGTKTLYVMTAGGSDFWSWAMDVVRPVLMRAARDADCDTLRATCRRGMARWLKQAGWHEARVVMESEVE